MKILIYGPKDRYDTYMPDFAADLPFETVFSSAVQPALQAAEENPDAEIVFADAITPVGREMIDLLPRLRMIHSEGWPSTPSTPPLPVRRASSCAITRGATPEAWPNIR